MQGLWLDCRYAARSLRRHRTFTCVAAAVLAVGVAAIVTMLSVVEAVDFPSLPFRAPDRLVLAEELVAEPDYPSGRLRATTADVFQQYQAARTFSAIGAVGYTRIVELARDDGPEMVWLNPATPNLFAVLGVTPLVGRFFRASDAAPGAPPVMVITFAFWKREFAGSPAVLGKTLRLNNLDGSRPPVEYTVVGVLPANIPDFTGLHGTGQFVPLDIGALDSDSVAAAHLGVFGRLRDGVTIGAAQAELTRLARRAAPSHSGERVLGVIAHPLESFYGYLAPARFTLLAVAVLILAMAVLNVANLMLARAASHAHETAVRLALGATRRRLGRQFVTESMMIAILGGLGAIPLTMWGTRAATVALGLKASGFQAAVDVKVFGAAVAVVAATGIACGLLPALVVARRNIYGVVRQAGVVVGARVSWQRLSDVLLVVQVAGALGLVFGSGIMNSEFRRLQDAAPGVDPTNVLEVNLTLGLPHVVSNRQALSQMLAGLSTLHGVNSAGLFASELDDTLEMTNGDGVVRRMPIRQDAVSEGTMRALRVSLIAGRTFTDTDFDPGASVGIVNDVLANTYWPNTSPIGRQVVVIPAADNDTSTALGLVRRQVVTIVGVMRTVRRYDVLDRTTPPQLVRPFTQVPSLGGPWLYIRTARPPMQLADDVRRVVQTVDPQDLFEDAVQPLRTRLDDVLSRARFTTRILTLGALLSLLVAILGIYGLVTYTISRQTTEIAIRMALGASEWGVVRLVMSHMALLASVGFVCGTIGCLGMARALDAVRYNAAPAAPDFVSFAASILGLLVVVATVGYIPARRAARLNPAVALHSS